MYAAVRCTVGGCIRDGGGRRRRRRSNLIVAPRGGKRKGAAAAVRIQVDKGRKEGRKARLRELGTSTLR